MSDLYQLKVKAMADEIRKKLKGSVLMGVPVDLGNVDQVLVAAWFIANTPKDLMTKVDGEDINLTK